MRAAQQHNRVAKLQCLESNTAACHVSFTCIGQDSCQAHAARFTRTVRSADRCIERKTLEPTQHNGYRLTDELSQP